MNLSRRQVKDERVVQMVKRYLKSGVMENGVVTETEEGSPTGRKSIPAFSKRVSERIRLGIPQEGRTVYPLCR